GQVHAADPSEDRRGSARPARRRLDPGGSFGGREDRRRGRALYVIALGRISPTRATDNAARFSAVRGFAERLRSAFDQRGRERPRDELPPRAKRWSSSEWVSNQPRTPRERPRIIAN